MMVMMMGVIMLMVSSLPSTQFEIGYFGQKYLIKKGLEILPREECVPPAPLP